MMEHKHAALLRIAADNADQLFECDGIDTEVTLGKIASVAMYPEKNWRPVKITKKIKRWMWADKDGYTSGSLHSEEEIENLKQDYTIKLLWSETEFEVVE